MNEIASSSVGERVLLVGTILQAAWAVFIVWYSTGGHLTLTFLVLGLVGGVGIACAVTAYINARRGGTDAAFAFGLAAALLPPLQVVTLIGAIMCKVAGATGKKGTGQGR